MWIRGPSIIVEFITNIKCNPRLYEILTIGFFASYNNELPKIVIRVKAINQLRYALQNESHQHIKTEAYYALGYILDMEREQYSSEVSNANILSLMVYYYMNKILMMI